MEDANILKKHFLVVFAHPNPKSFNYSIMEETVKQIKEQGHTVDISDLYRMDFKGFAGEHDFKTHLNKSELNLINEQQNSMKNNLFADDLAIEIDKLRRADYLILIFPIWWGGAPSILKGWIDRVFACDFAWGFENFFHKGLFLGKRAAIFTTTGSSKESYSINGANKATLEQMLISLHRGSLAFCGFDVLPIYSLLGVDDITEENRKDHLENISQIIKNFGTCELLHKMSN